MAAEVVVYADAVVRSLVESQLKRTEERGGSRDGGGDEAKFSQDALPGLAGDSLGVAKVGEDCGERLLAVWR